MTDTLPRVLVLDLTAWRKDSTAHTLMDIFSCWDPDKLALVYCSSELPDSNKCSNYFQISESQMIRSVLKPWIKVGRRVENTPRNDDKDTVREQKMYRDAHKNNRKWMRLAREVVWKLGHWKTGELDKFVKEFNPDIIFVPIFPYAYPGRIQQHIFKLTGKPTVCYLADDNYSYDACSDWMDYLQRTWVRKYVGPLARNSSDMFVIVEKEKEDTDARFGTDSKILTKGIDFSNRPYVEHKINDPIQFIYTGGLIIGRDRTLALVADAINKVNKEKGHVVAELNIYSQTTPSDAIMARINHGASHFCGQVSRDDVLRLQSQADVAIFAESLVGKEANKAKLSFSTKITDYLGNGKCVFAIGKDYIAPIDYFVRNDSAIVATDEAEIENKIRTLIDNPDLITEYGRKAYDCAVRNHERSMINKRFIDCMTHVANEHITKEHKLNRQ